jgi:TPR repeat protein
VLFLGDGISMNKSLVTHYLKLPVDQGHTKRQFNYGVMLSREEGISMKKLLVAHYCKLSADEGFPLAQLLYAMWLVESKDGLRQRLDCEQYL